MKRLLSLLLLVAQTPVVRANAQATTTPPRRLAVTPELLRSAFADPLARTILERARAARLAQDSALHSYDAKSYFRFSVGMGVRKLSPEKLLLRTEQSARVQWAGGANISIEPTGRRTAFPMGNANVDLTNATPIPYFPGREALWIPSSKMGVAQAEVDEDEFIHPLATGAEAYYRYASGDSLTIGLPDGRRIALRELRVSARRADWHAFVGSFWFDTGSGSLVRAAYRMSALIDFWQTMSDDNRKVIEKLEARARADTGAAARAAKEQADSARGTPMERLGVKLLQGTLTPAQANLSAVTVEYGLYEGRFWLPKLNVANGEIVMGFMRLPMTWQEKFDYESVNSGQTVVPVPSAVGLAPGDTLWSGGGSLNISVGEGGKGATPKAAAESPESAAGRGARYALQDSLANRYTRQSDSLKAEAAKARAAGDTARARQLSRSAAFVTSGARQLSRQREGCSADSSYYAGGANRYGGIVRTLVRMPCDISRLSNSPDLPGSIYDNGEQIFGTADRDALLASLDFSLQPGWSPQMPQFNTGLSFLRYNRIEGLSLGGSATSALGMGYTAQATARIGIGDRIPNGELSLERSNGRDAVHVAAYHRLAVANDDWGNPLSFGASVANLLYAHDEGFYYRTLGAEVGGVRDAPLLSGATLTWRAFAERQRSAGVGPNTQASLKNLLGTATFERNIDAAPLNALGAGADVARTFGVDPAAAQLYTRLRAEGAFTNRSDSIGNSGYGRLTLDATLTRNYGPLAAALTGAAGTSAGTLPLQRAFFVGGLQTVRGQIARPDGEGRVGDSFWLGRLEVGPKSLAMRPTVFYDIGWAGARSEFTNGERPLQGAGVGLSMLDGLLRFDLARGIRPEHVWRFDLSLGSIF